MFVKLLESPQVDVQEQVSSCLCGIELAWRSFVNSTHSVLAEIFIEEKS